jgi:hypothetical protein
VAVEHDEIVRRAIVACEAGSAGVSDHFIREASALPVLIFDERVARGPDVELVPEKRHRSFERGAHRGPIEGKAAATVLAPTAAAAPLGEAPARAKQVLAGWMGSPAGGEFRGAARASI